MESIDLLSKQEITLFTDDEHVDLKEIDFEFEQSNKMRGFNNKLTLFNGAHCYQLIHNKHQRKYKFRLSIHFLNPLPVRQHKIAWKWLIAAIPFFLLSAIMIYAGLFSDTFKPSTYFLTILIAVFSALLICVLLTIQRSYDKWIFVSDCGKVNLIELLSNQPDPETFKTFVERLTLQIRKAKLTRNLSQSDLLAGELRELRRLKDETVISNEEYENAKRLIFNHEGYGSTGTRQ